MNRRTVLTGVGATLATALAGCLGQVTGSDDGNGTGDDPPNGDATAGRRYEIRSTDEQPASPLEHEVTLEQPRIDSPEQPLSLDVSVTNTGEKTVRYGEKRSALALYERDGEFALYAPGEDRKFDENVGLWFVSEPVAITMEYRVGKLLPGATDTQTLELVHVDDDPPETAPESLAFDAPYGVTTDGTLPEGSNSFEWGFTLAAVA